jgi:hypothetical protein
MRPIEEETDQEARRQGVGRRFYRANTRSDRIVSIARNEESVFNIGEIRHDD